MQTIHDIPQHVGKGQFSPNYAFDIFEVGDQVAMHGYSDVNPGTVVKVSPNGKTVYVQSDSAEAIDTGKLKFHVGGFSAHCSNQEEQEWKISRNENGGITKYSLKKWRGRYCWTITGSAADGRQRLTKGWGKFYDYNF